MSILSRMLLFFNTVICNTICLWGWHRSYICTPPTLTLVECLPRTVPYQNGSTPYHPLRRADDGRAGDWVVQDPGFDAVDLFEEFGGEYVEGFAVRDHAAGFHDEEFVAVAGGEVEVVDCDDGLTFGVGDDVADDGEQADLVVEVEGGGGFVEKEELGFAYQHLGDADELALAA